MMYVPAAKENYVVYTYLLDDVCVHNIVLLGRIWVCLAQHLLSNLVILGVTRVEGVDAHGLLCCRGDLGFHLILQHQSAWQSKTKVSVQNCAVCHHGSLCHLAQVLNSRCAVLHSPVCMNSCTSLRSPLQASGHITRRQNESTLVLDYRTGTGMDQHQYGTMLNHVKYRSAPNLAVHFDVDPCRWSFYAV